MWHGLGTPVVASRPAVEDCDQRLAVQDCA